jgi:predicted dehydrogenase
MFDSSNRLRLGILGCGGRGIGVAQEFQDCGYGRVTALCDVSESSLKKAKAAFPDAMTTKDIPELGKRTDVDAVFIASPDDKHVDNALALLPYKKHILLEKPLATSVEDCDRLVNGYAREKDTVQMVGLCMRYTNLMMRVHELVSSGAIGEVMTAHCVDYVSVGGDYYFHRWMSRKKHVVGLLLQKGCHSLDFISWIINSRPVKVHAFGGLDYYGGEEPVEKACSSCDEFNTCSERMEAVTNYDYIKNPVKVPDECAFSRAVDVCDNSVVNVMYESGAKLSYTEVHFAPDYVREFSFVGTKGRIEVAAPHRGPQEIFLTFRHRSQKLIHETIEPSPGGHGGGDRAMMAEFVNAINAKRAPLTDFAAGRECAAISLCAEHSIENGRVMEVRNCDGTPRNLRVQKGRARTLVRPEMVEKRNFKL